MAAYFIKIMTPSSIPSKKLLATETLDPQHHLMRWLTPSICRLGWQAWSLPTYEAIHLLGYRAYNSMVLQIVNEWRPHILLVHPPYDFLSLKSCQQIREWGCKIVAFIWDCELMEKNWSGVIAEDIQKRFDVCTTLVHKGKMVESGVKTALWTMAPESVAVDDPTVPIHEAVLLGCCTPARVNLAKAIAASGIKIACYGTDWMNGVVSRPVRLSLMRRAKVVITPYEKTSDIFQMIDAALVGAKQIVGYHEDIEKYNSSEVSIETYRSVEECITKLHNVDSIATWTAPSWEKLWPEIIADLELPEQPETEASPTLVQLYASMINVYEKQQRFFAAMSCLQAWSHIAPEDWGHKFIQTRYMYQLKRWKKVVEMTSSLISEIQQEITATSLPMFLPESCFGNGLGNSGSINPIIEVMAMRLYCLVQDEQFHIALEEIEKIPKSYRKAIQGSLLFIPDSSEMSDLWHALSK